MIATNFQKHYLVEQCCIPYQELLNMLLPTPCIY